MMWRKSHKMEVEDLSRALEGVAKERSRASAKSSLTPPKSTKSTTGSSTPPKRGLVTPKSPPSRLLLNAEESGRAASLKLKEFQKEKERIKTAKGVHDKSHFKVSDGSGLVGGWLGHELKKGKPVQGKIGRRSSVMR